jgi:hypothetical protein
MYKFLLRHVILFSLDTIYLFRVALYVVSYWLIGVGDWF